MKKGSIVIVDDNQNVLDTLRILLSSFFADIYCLSSPNTLLHVVKENNPDIALLDMNYSTGINTGNEGLFWLGELRKVNPDIPVVLFTAYADIELAVKSLKSGANDFIVKPWDNAKLIATLQSAYTLSLSRKEVHKLKEKQEEINHVLTKVDNFCWGQSQAMQNLLSLIQKVAPTDANVLVTGENGTGKEQIAKMIHQLSNRKNETMITVDMGAVTESLFESELFGHVKGSFTDAKTDRLGKFEVADKGTLFLDEIGNLNKTLQSKLLTALQTRSIVKVGSNKLVNVDIRLICATNANLAQEVSQDKFREDLLYRINTIELQVPPLRDRKEDIPQLVEYFLHSYRTKYNKVNLRITEDALKHLQNYAWPGNVRELQHALEKAVILSDGITLQVGDFYMNTIEEKKAIMESVTIEEMEMLLIQKALKRHQNNLSNVAQDLGITRPTLYSKIKKYGL